MGAHIEVAIGRQRAAPIEQERMKSLPCEPFHQGDVGREVENEGRIDQLRDEDHRPSAGAGHTIIAQPRATLAMARRGEPRASGTGRLLERGEAGERRGASVRRCCGFAAQHVEKQRQGPWPVLRCGIAWW